MILRPHETFTVVRLITDHTDSNTYYVRAVVRNSRTDAVITTLNLTDQGSRRFTKNYRIPEFNGDLMFMDITTTVYTDSGYTTKASAYGEEVITLQIERQKPQAVSSGINYDKVERMINTAISGIKMPEIPEKQEKVDIDYERIDAMVNKRIASVERSLGSIQPETVDISPVVQAVSELKLALIDRFDNLSIPEPKIDMKPVTDAFQRSGIPQMLEDFDNASAVLLKVSEEVPQMSDKIAEVASAIKDLTLELAESKAISANVRDGLREYSFATTGKKEEKQATPNRKALSARAQALRSR